MSRRVFTKTWSFASVRRQLLRTWIVEVHDMSFCDNDKKDTMMTDIVCSRKSLFVAFHSFYISYPEISYEHIMSSMTPVSCAWDHLIDSFSFLILMRGALSLLRNQIKSHLLKKFNFWKSRKKRKRVAFAYASTLFFAQFNFARLDFNNFNLITNLNRDFVNFINLDFVSRAFHETMEEVYPLRHLLLAMK